ncbi:MFS transporter [Crenobacter cavernae]|uniref:MFS transporter n=1 Tax=Crenobacter cavernae TaxID=2290923 RepID=A0A345Y4T8_9NEIS|nr:MFS transporter [Crenobacter cavernae]AXK38940.1 MFS transporter [Crenobacter cavernae]
MQPQSDDHRDGVPLPQRYWAILTIALGVTMAVLDGAIANVALPAIARDLDASPASSIWVVNAYQLSITVSLLAFAALGDIVGYRRIYQAGLVVFTVTSGLCALSDSLATLTCARVLQGLGAAGVMSVNTALIRTIYPKAFLGRGLAINSFLVAFSSAAGPTIASAILSLASWQWLFAVNLPIGLVASFIALRALPDNTHRARVRFDMPSALLNAATFGLLIFAVDGFGHGQSPLVVGGLLVALLVVGTIFVRRQLGLAVPLLPIDLLRIPLFGLSICTSICSFTAQALALVSLPFFLQGMLGRSQVETGLLMTPWPLAIMCVAPFAGRLLEKYSPGLLGGLGLAMLSAGLALLATLPPSPDNVDIAWRMALCGAGFGLFQSPNNFALLSSAPPQRSGGASGMLGTARLVGQTGGAALVALLFNWFPANGSHVTLLVAAVAAALASVVSCLRIANTGVHAIVR